MLPRLLVGRYVLDGLRVEDDDVGKLADGDLSAVESHLDGGADPNVRGRQGWTAVMIAANPQPDKPAAGDAIANS